MDEYYIYSTPATTNAKIAIWFPIRALRALAALVSDTLVGFCTGGIDPVGLLFIVTTKVLVGNPANLGALIVVLSGSSSLAEVLNSGPSRDRRGDRMLVVSPSHVVKVALC